MKKKLALSLAAVMLLLSACGGPASGGESSSEPSASSGQTSVSASTQVPGGNAVQFDPSATIEETVLVDESDVKITVTGIKYTA